MPSRGFSANAKSRLKEMRRITRRCKRRTPHAVQRRMTFRLCRRGRSWRMAAASISATKDSKPSAFRRLKSIGQEWFALENVLRTSQGESKWLREKLSRQLRRKGQRRSPLLPKSAITSVERINSSDSSPATRREEAACSVSHHIFVSQQRRERED